MTGEVLEQRERCGRVRAADVVGDLRVEPDGGDAAAAHDDLHRGEPGARDAQQTWRSFGLRLVQRALGGGGRHHRNGARVRHGRGDGPEAHPFHDAEPKAELEDVVRELLPAEVRLGTVEHQEVAPRSASPVELERGPHEARQCAVDHVERGTS